MNYSYKQISDTDWNLAVYLGDEIIYFSMSTDLEKGLPEHVQMIQDFIDTTKLEYFVQLLIENPATAFTIYNNLD
jgi:hypothetical protein